MLRSRQGNRPIRWVAACIRGGWDPVTPIPSIGFAEVEPNSKGPLDFQKN